jgi:hypothetical protein
MSNLYTKISDLNSKYGNESFEFEGELVEHLKKKIKKRFMRTMKLGLIIGFLLLLYITIAKADHGGEGKFVVIPYKGGKPNNTVELTAKDSRAVVIFSGGGRGLFKWTPDHRSNDFPTTVAVMNLNKKNISVLVPDWPYSLKIEHKNNIMYCGMRCSEETQERLLNVLDYATKNYPGQPIWLVGHSNGTVTIEYFAKYLKKLNRLSDLKGAVSSGTTRETRIDVPELRVAFLHHSKDNCEFTSPSDAKQAFAMHKKWLGENATMTWVEGGHNGGKWDRRGKCVAGTHSYEFAEDEVTAKLEAIISQK